MAIWFFMSDKKRLSALRESSGKRLHKYVKRSLRDEYIIRDAGVLEGLRKGDAQLHDVVIEALQCDNTLVFRMLNYLPEIVSLASHETVASTGARRALELLKARIPTGPDACPKCGGNSARTGNATGWTCIKCNLNYNPSGPQDPLTFHIGDLWGGGPPWHPERIVALIKQVEDAGSEIRSQETWRINVLQEAEVLAKERQRILQKYS